MTPSQRAREAAAHILRVYGTITAEDAAAIRCGEWDETAEVQAFAQFEAETLEGAEWQPIETAPRDGTWFLAFWPVSAVENQVRVTQWMDDPHEPYFIDADDWCDWTQPTAWMPLPPAPETPNER